MASQRVCVSHPDLDDQCVDVPAKNAAFLVANNGWHYTDSTSREPVGTEGTAPVTTTESEDA